MRFSLFRVRSPLLTESLLFSLPAGTEMFHFPAFPPHTLCIQMWVTRHHARWVPPFGHPRITARLAAPRGLSQPPTSFIGSWCQGIHRVLLHTYIHKQLKMLASTVQFSNNTHQPHPHQIQTRHIGNQCHQKQPDPAQTRPNGVVSDTQQCVSSGPRSPRRVESRTSGAPDSHGVTGGVYKARERIHRAMADARLLANPASWSRVADSSPN